ncbi:MAG TPA: ATP-binding protein [Streptosporangiaceae bacterium]|jgi:anti-sigma regulatory factor (Ser/Thr protein kinase)|nr:ATP-binding protein [Streptosporangiaceae bacterium]
MTAHRAASPVTAQVMSVSHDWLPAPVAITDIPYQSGPCHSAPLVEELSAAQPSATCALRALPESVKAGRDFTRALMAEWNLSEIGDSLSLVASELITNALRHGVGAPARPRDKCPIQLRLLAQVPYVMCLVTDPGTEIPVLQNPGPWAETGRGLNVVDTCSVRWGWHLLDGGGKVVWAVLRSGA